MNIYKKLNSIIFEIDKYAFRIFEKENSRTVVAELPN